LKEKRYTNLPPKDFQKNGIECEVRIFAHSHGGNLVLNLGAIDELLENKKLWFGKSDQEVEKIKFSELENKNNSMIKMAKILNALPNENEAAKLKGQKKLSFMPTQKTKLKVEKFILLGTPIQRETEDFVHSKIFSNVYNIYSESDRLQPIDIFSTKGDGSRQRIELKYKDDKIRQLKIEISQEPTLIDGNKKFETDNSKRWKLAFLSSLWKSSFSEKEIAAPNHRELWFASWKQQNYQKKSIMGRLPLISFVPVLIDAIDKSNVNDCTVILTAENNNYLAVVTEKDKRVKISESKRLDGTLVETVKTKFASWQPDEELLMKEYNLLKKLER